jgi:ribonuclease BN (tRNA processing enzyme)
MIHRFSELVEKFVLIFTTRLDFSLKRSCLGWLKMGWLVAFPLFVLAVVPCSGMGQNGPSANAPKGVQILLLGTNAGPGLYKERSEPSSLLIVDGRQYLIDCGIGTIRRMARAGIQSKTVRTIFFAHLHPDHALGLADLMANDAFTSGLAGTVPTININGPPETAEFVKAALNYISISFGIFEAEGLPGSVHAAHFEAHDISKNGAVYQDEKIRVIAAESTHYPANARALSKSYAYRFETPYGVIVFTGDTGQAML